jgi:predicted amidophosphoribosyltransferase
MPIATTAICLECKKEFEDNLDIQLCDDCMKKFEVERLWQMHDNGELDALDFNESKVMRESFRK